MIERLSPPESRVIIMASDRMPSSGIWNAIDRSTDVEKKSPPISRPKKTSSTARSALRPVLVPPTGSFRRLGAWMAGLSLLMRAPS
jgi:hypothetical protein